MILKTDKMNYFCHFGQKRKGRECGVSTERKEVQEENGKSKCWINKSLLDHPRTVGHTEEILLGSSLSATPSSCYTIVSLENLFQDGSYLNSFM